MHSHNCAILSFIFVSSKVDLFSPFLLICWSADRLICWSIDNKTSIIQNDDCSYDLLICWSIDLLIYWSDNLLIFQRNVKHIIYILINYRFFIYIYSFIFLSVDLYYYIFMNFYLFICWSLLLHIYEFLSFYLLIFIITYLWIFIFLSTPPPPYYPIKQRI